VGLCPSGRNCKVENRQVPAWRCARTQSLPRPLGPLSGIVSVASPPPPVDCEISPETNQFASIGLPNIARISGDALAVATDDRYTVEDLNSSSMYTSSEVTNATIARAPIKPSIRECDRGTLGLVIGTGGVATGNRVGRFATLEIRRIVTSAQNPSVETIKTGTNTISIHPAAWFQTALGNSTTMRPSRNNTGHPMSRIRLSIFTAGVFLQSKAVGL